MIVGIVGNEAAKFTPEMAATAKLLIRSLLTAPEVTSYCSGHCHLGGIDIWTEEIGNALPITPFIYPPRELMWAPYGYKERNILIAQKSDVVHNIVVSRYPKDYSGMRFDSCYHCGTRDHVKSGGCWTAKYALRLGKQAEWHIL